MSSSSRSRGVLGRVGELEALDHVVAQPDRVREALEADRVLTQAGNRQHPGHGAVRDDQTVVAELVLGPSWSRMVTVRARRIAADRGPQPELRLLEDVAKRRDHVPRLERPRRGLRQERRVEQEVDVVDERDAGARAGHRALQLSGGVQAAEAATGDDDVPGHEPIVASVCNNLLQMRSSRVPPTGSRSGTHQAPFH